VAPHNREVSHPQPSAAFFLHDRHTSQPFDVAGIPSSDVFEEAMIDLVDDLEVARQNLLE
jgi:hypothetical protein